MKTVVGIASALLVAGCAAPTAPTETTSSMSTASVGSTPTPEPSIRPTALASAPVTPAPEGSLIVEQRSGGGRSYTEGSIPFVKIVRDGVVVREERLDPSPKTFALPPGTYELSEYQRPCDGHCGNLDPPTDVCSAPIEIAAGASVHAVATVKYGEGCKIAVQPGKP